MSSSMTFTVTVEPLNAADGGVLDPVEVSYFEARLQEFLNTADVALRLGLTASDGSGTGREGTAPPEAGPGAAASTVPGAGAMDVEPARDHVPAYAEFRQWMDEHDKGPRSVSVGQIGRAFPRLSFATVCDWIGYYREHDRQQVQCPRLGVSCRYRNPPAPIPRPRRTRGQHMSGSTSPALFNLDGGTLSSSQPVPLVAGMHVRVHYNLNRGGFSVVVGGHVAAVVPDITLTAVRFYVQPAGLARIRREGRRVVCAYATGVIAAAGTAPDITGMQRVRFNPAPDRPDTFTLDDDTPVHAAPRVVFAPDPASPAGRRRPGYGWTETRSPAITR